MSLQLAFAAVAVFGILLILMCGFVFYIKVVRVSEDKQKKAYQKLAKPILEGIMEFYSASLCRESRKASEAEEEADGSEDRDTNGTDLSEKKIRELRKITNHKRKMRILEDMLLEIIAGTDRMRALAAGEIAYSLGFPEKCLSQISSRYPDAAAIASRKAGIYQYEKAVPGMLSALSYFWSGEVQFQILMALARIGDAAAFEQAIDRIQKHIFVNERAFAEILETFGGDKFDLHKRMIHGKVEYVTLLFLKFMDGDTAGRLAKEIIVHMGSDLKRMRLAAITALGKTGDSAYAAAAVGALRDREWEVRSAAARVLGRLVNPLAVRPLAEAACDKEWWVRQNAVASIMAYPDSADLLVAIAGSGDRYACESILFALEKAGDAETLRRVREAGNRIHSFYG